MQVQLFLDYLKNVKRYSSHTIVAYETDLHQFFQFCGIKAEEENFSKITAKVVRRWLGAEMSGKMRGGVRIEKLKAASGKRKLTSVKMFFQFLLKNGVVKVNPAEGISGPKLPKRLPIFVPEEQMENLLDKMEAGEGFHQLRDWLILLLAYDTGMRRSEIVGMCVEDVDFSRKCLRVQGKGGKQREIPLMEELLEDMQYYLEERKKVVEFEHGKFFVTDKGKPIYAQFVYRLVTACLGEYTTLSKRSPHVLRHTFATHLLNHGGSIEGIKELLGHSNLAATQVYTHTSVKDMLRIFKQAHPRA